MLKLDHIAVSGQTLAEATRHVETALGVTLAPGGRHEVMGTHNTLLGLGPEVYLEAIAIDPDATPPNRPRWFAMDDFTGRPRLTNWIVQTDDIDAALDRLGPEFGVPITFTRGDLKWQMAVPEDGVLPWGGFGPAIIQWRGDHPAPRLPESDIRLSSLTLHHPQADEISNVLAPILADKMIGFAPSDVAGLIAEFSVRGVSKSLT